MTIDGAAPQPQRLHFLDNLRTLIIFLVVALHVGLVYEASGIPAPWWIVDDPATNDLVGLLNLVLDIVLMPTLFFVSGYLTPGSLGRRTVRQFVGARFRRLMLPWAVAAFTLLPLYKVVFLHSRGLPQEHWTTYFHFSNGIWGMNWLWFLPVLFLFSVLYLPLSRLGWAPTRLRLGIAVAAFTCVGVVNSFGMEALGLSGWTKTWLVDFQNERLLVYFLAFLLGSLCFHRRVFAEHPRRKGLYLLVAATAWVPINVYLLFLLVPWIKPGTVLISPLADRITLWLAFYLSLLSLGYLLLGTFRRFLDRGGTVWRELGRNSYAVYILHVVALGGFALLLMESSLGSLTKFLVVTLSAWLASNLVASLYRRVVALTGIGRPAARLEEEPARALT